MKGYLVREMYKTEIFICILSVIFYLLYIYNRKKSQIIKIKDSYLVYKNRKSLNEGRYVKKAKIRTLIVFIISIFAKKNLGYGEKKEKTVIAGCILVNLIILIVIITVDKEIILRILLQITSNLLLFKTVLSVSIFKYKSDVYKLINKLQNEIVQNKEIIISMKSALNKTKRSMIVFETEKIINELVKNVVISENTNYKIYLYKTSGYELSLILIFLKDSSISGNKKAIKRNLSEIERYCSDSYERYKDSLFSKIPYVCIILLMPLFLIWMDSFSSGDLFTEMVSVEPKEYIYLFSVVLAYIFMNF